MLIVWICHALVSELSSAQQLPTLAEVDTKPPESSNDDAGFPEDDSESLGATVNSGFSMFRGRMQHYGYNDEGDMELLYDADDEGLDVLIRDDPESTGQFNNIHSVSIHMLGGTTKSLIIRIVHDP